MRSIQKNWNQPPGRAAERLDLNATLRNRENYLAYWIIAKVAWDT